MEHQVKQQEALQQSVADQKSSENIISIMEEHEDSESLFSHLSTFDDKEIPKDITKNESLANMIKQQKKAFSSNPTDNGRDNSLFSVQKYQEQQQQHVKTQSKEQSQYQATITSKEDQIIQSAQKSYPVKHPFQNQESQNTPLKKISTQNLSTNSMRSSEQSRRGRPQNSSNVQDSHSSNGLTNTNFRGSVGNTSSQNRISFQHGKLHDEPRRTVVVQTQNDIKNLRRKTDFNAQKLSNQNLEMSKSKSNPSEWKKRLTQHNIQFMKPLIEEEPEFQSRQVTKKYPVTKPTANAKYVQDKQHYSSKYSKNSNQNTLNKPPSQFYVPKAKRGKVDDIQSYQGNSVGQDQSIEYNMRSSEAKSYNYKDNISTGAFQPVEVNKTSFEVRYTQNQQIRQEQIPLVYFSPGHQDHFVVKRFQPIVNCQNESEMIRQNLKLLQSELFEKAAKGELLIEKNLFVAKMADKLSQSESIVLTLLQKAMDLNIVHETKRNFANNVMISYISLQLDIVSHECLQWVISSLQIDEMTPSERTVQSRIKEAFALKISPVLWQVVLLSIKNDKLEQILSHRKYEQLDDILVDFNEILTFADWESEFISSLEQQQEESKEPTSNYNQELQQQQYGTKQLQRSYSEQLILKFEVDQDKILQQLDRYNIRTISVTEQQIRYNSMLQVVDIIEDPQIGQRTNAIYFKHQPQWEAPSQFDIANDSFHYDHLIAFLKDYYYNKEPATSSQGGGSLNQNRNITKPHSSMTQSNNKFSSSAVSQNSSSNKQTNPTQLIESNWCSSIENALTRTLSNSNQQQQQQQQQQLHSLNISQQNSVGNPQQLTTTTRNSLPHDNRRKSYGQVSEHSSNQANLEIIGRAIPGGRYGCAQFVKTCGPEVLQRCSLGKLAQMVQHAVKDDILRYKKTLLVWTQQVDPNKKYNNNTSNRLLTISNQTSELNSNEPTSGVSTNTVSTAKKTQQESNQAYKLSQVKKELIKLLGEHKNGISLAQLPLALRPRLSFPFKINELGFAKLKDLIVSMLDVIELDHKGHNHPFAVLINQPQNQTKSKKDSHQSSSKKNYGHQQAVPPYTKRSSETSSHHQNGAKQGMTPQDPLQQPIDKSTLDSSMKDGATANGLNISDIIVPPNPHVLQQQQQQQQQQSLKQQFQQSLSSGGGSTLASSEIIQQQLQQQQQTLQHQIQQFQSQGTLKQTQFANNPNFMVLQQHPTQGSLLPQQAMYSQQQPQPQQFSQVNQTSQVSSLQQQAQQQARLRAGGDQFTDSSLIQSQQQQLQEMQQKLLQKQIEEQQKWIGLQQMQQKQYQQQNMMMQNQQNKNLSSQIGDSSRASFWFPSQGNQQVMVGSENNKIQQPQPSQSQQDQIFQQNLAYQAQLSSQFRSQGQDLNPAQSMLQGQPLGHQIVQNQATPQMIQQNVNLVARNSNQGQDQFQMGAFPQGNPMNVWNSHQMFYTPYLRSGNGDSPQDESSNSSSINKNTFM